MADQPTLAAEQIAIRDLLSRINDAWIKQRGEQGRDVFVLARHDKKWLAVWRAMLVEPG